MKISFVVFSFVGLLGLVGLHAEANLEAIKERVDQAQGSDEKAKALYDLAQAFSQQGDHARALNQLEKVQGFIFEVESQELVNQIESLYWKSFNNFNVINPRQSIYDAKQKQIEEERRIEEEKAERARLKAELGNLSFVETHVDAYRTALKRGRPRFRRRLSPLSMGHLNGLNTVIGVPELDSAYLLPLRSDVSFDYRFDLGFYKENSTDGLAGLQVESSIVRGLYEITLPYKTFRNLKLRRRSFASKSVETDFARKNSPFDLKIGIPVVRWSSRPLFYFDRTNIAGTTLMDGENGTIALGDIFVEMKTAFISTPTSAFGAKVRVKLPTGNKGELSGTGSFDVAGAALYSSSIGPHHMNMNLGYVMVGDSGNFIGGTVDLSDVLFFGGDFAFNIVHHHFLLVSLDYHQNAFRDYTNIPVLEDPPMSVGFGYATQLYNDRLYIGFKSGLNGASADQSFMITLRRLH